MASKEKATLETVQQAHARIRAEAIAYFVDKPHSADDRLERIRKKMCEFKRTTYMPPKSAPPVAVKAEEMDPTVTLMDTAAAGVLTETPDTGESDAEF